MKKFFLKRCKMVLQCYNRLESLLGLTEVVTPGVLQGVTRCYKNSFYGHLWKSQRERTFFTFSKM
jgi:hypothetical protein